MGLTKKILKNTAKAGTVVLLTIISVTCVWAKIGENAYLDGSRIRIFSQIYEPDLGPMETCDGSTNNDLSFCYAPLRSPGNAPFILTPTQAPKAVVVLFHGLSDSPFFMRSIAEFLQKKHYLVVVPLTPGHGINNADGDMQDENLQTRWYQHIDKVMNFAQDFDLPLVLGGFSTGGTFAAHYTIEHPDQVAAMLLFSGALELSSSAEAMSKIWGMKALARLLDGEYETQGAHPFKYPSVASYSGLVLMDIIKDIRNMLTDRRVNTPIFAAHSLADKVTMFAGIEFITEHFDGDHTIFKIGEDYDVCHADLPMSSQQIVNLKFDKSKVNTNEQCAVPKANPLHATMLLMLNEFLREHVQVKVN